MWWQCTYCRGAMNNVETFLGLLVFTGCWGSATLLFCCQSVQHWVLDFNLKVYRAQNRFENVSKGARSRRGSAGARYHSHKLGKCLQATPLLVRSGCQLQFSVQAEFNILENMITWEMCYNRHNSAFSLHIWRRWEKESQRCLFWPLLCFDVCQNMIVGETKILSYSHAQ